MLEIENDVKLIIKQETIKLKIENYSRLLELKLETKSLNLTFSLFLIYSCFIICQIRVPTTGTLDCNLNFEMKNDFERKFLVPIYLNGTNFKKFYII